MCVFIHTPGGDGDNNDQAAKQGKNARRFAYKQEYPNWIQDRFDGGEERTGQRRTALGGEVK